jgi:hypothetical protein
MKKYKIEEGLVKQVLGMVNSTDADINQKESIVNKAIALKNTDARLLKNLQDNMKKSQNTVNQVIGLATDRDARNALKVSSANLNKTYKDKIKKVGNDIDTIKSEVKEALAIISAQKTTDRQDLQDSTQHSFKDTQSFLEESNQLLSDAQLSNLEDFLKKSPYLMLQILVAALIKKEGYRSWSLEELAQHPEDLKSPEMKAKVAAVFNQKMPDFFNKMFLKIFPASSPNPVAFAKAYPDEIADVNNPNVRNLLDTVANAFS